MNENMGNKKSEHLQLPFKNKGQFDISWSKSTIKSTISRKNKIQVRTFKAMFTTLYKLQQSEYIPSPAPLLTHVIENAREVLSQWTTTDIPCAFCLLFCFLSPHIKNKSAYNLYVYLLQNFNGYLRIMYSLQINF